MVLRTVIFLLLASLLVANAQRGQQGRKQKPSERSQQQREKGGKDVSWFKVDEDDKEACTDVVESEKTIITGPPADQCQEDNERFCFCGKKGTKETSNWKYLCGECRENKPFSFKIEKPGGRGGGGRGGKLAKAACPDGNRPACADGSRPQKPKEEGSPPQCDDGDTPVCSDGTEPKRPSPCQDDSEPMCRSSTPPKQPVCGDGSPLKLNNFGPPCTRSQGKPKCEDDDVKPTCEDGSMPKGPGGRGGKGGKGQGGKGGGRGGRGGTR